MFLRNVDWLSTATWCYISGNRTLRNYRYETFKPSNPANKVVVSLRILTYRHVYLWLQTGFWIGWLDLLTPYTHNSELQAITALSLIYTLQSSPLHTHWGSQSSLVVSWQRIYSSLSLQITHEVFFSEPNSLLSIILHLPIPKTGLNSIPLLPRSYPGRLVSRNSTQLLLLNWTLLYIHFARTTQKTQPL
jgi:hypothetical protein